MIRSEIIADSVAPCGSRLTTYVLTYPRFIHAELMTHRSFSRNASSSRAIPIKKMIDAVRNSPAVPTYWGKNQKGMQAREQIDLGQLLNAQDLWAEAAANAVRSAEKMAELGLHKQVVNRVLEPFVHITTIVSATDFQNFFGLRVHEDAQPEICELATLMLRDYISSKPKELKQGEWHIPFCDRFVSKEMDESSLLKLSVARCARVSYLNFDNEIDNEKDLALYQSLTKSGHFSPLEHQGRAESTRIRSGNFIGFTQYRKLFPNEAICLTNQQLEDLYEAGSLGKVV